MCQTTAQAILVTLGFNSRLPNLLRGLLLTVLILHLDAKSVVSSASVQEKKVRHARPYTEALPDCTLNWVTVRPVVFIRDMEQKAAILREGVMKPLKAFGLDAALIALVAPSFLLRWGLNDRHGAIGIRER